MNAQMINQRFQFAKKNPTKYEIEKFLDADRWITTYITSLPIETPTSEVREIIKDFAREHIEKLITNDDLTLERNAMLGYWQFSVTTFSEVTKFKIVEDTADEKD